MIKLVIVVLAGLIPVAPLLVWMVNRHRHNTAQATNDLVVGLKVFNLVLGLMAIGMVVAWFASPSAVLAAGTALQDAAADPYVSLAAAISTGLAAIGAGIAVGGTGAAAIGAVAEKPETFGRSLIFVGLAEGIAIYGLAISFIVLFV